ncbi:MAG: PQQ-binding-like beta-propeller repeat protein, partial [Acidobacteria bacterium]|nr:PQQ-binding-like beta-propeller repeat protein [Acidobacteriota bacterium]
MKKIALLLFLPCLMATLPGAWKADSPPEAQRFWPQWRGPESTGVAPFADPPLEWAEGRNVRWKTEIPGKGSSSPIVWGDRIFVTTAIPTGQPVKPAEPEPPQEPASSQGRRGPRGIRPESVQDFAIIAVHRRTGEILWRRSLRQELPHEGTHPTGTWASNSPVTDGTHVYAYFGSRGLYCLDMEGKLVWEKDLGDMTIKLGFGEGSSPALFDDKIVLNWDHEGESFIIALDKKTGKEIWRTGRDERTAWATPLIVEHKGTRQVVTSA